MTFSKTGFKPSVLFLPTLTKKFTLFYVIIYCNFISFYFNLKQIEIVVFELLDFNFLLIFFINLIRPYFR